MGKKSGTYFPPAVLGRYEPYRVHRIAKLKARYGGKFDAIRAEKRDLNLERKLLESRYQDFTELDDNDVMNPPVSFKKIHKRVGNDEEE